MTWFSITASVGAALIVLGLIINRKKDRAGDDYLSGVVAMLLYVIAAVLELVAAVGWIASL